MTAALETTLLDSAGARPAAARPRLAAGLMRKGFWAVADQGLFAGSNCIVNIMLANWLSPTEYGAFSTAFAAFLLVGVIHTATLTEPMLVYAPDRYKSKLKDYLGALLRWHVAVSLVGSLALAAAGAYLKWRGQAALARALFWFAVAGPFTLFLWLMRRASYAQMNPRRAAQAGLGYLVIVMASLAVIHGLGVLSLGIVLVMMGACSLAAGLWLAAGHVRFGRLPDHMLREVGADHWRYGTWAAATQLLSFIPGNLYYFLLPKMATLEQSGALRALTNLVNPFIQANAAMCLLLLPTFVRSKGTSEGKRVHRLALLGLAGGPLLYWLFLGLFNHQIIHLIYRDKYQQYAGLLWIIALQPVILGMSGTYGSLLRAHQKLNAIFWSGVVAAATAVSLGIEMTLKFGMAGVCWSIVITYTVHHIALWLFSRNVHWKGRQAPPATEELEAGMSGQALPSP
jgi:O-antigen/teichoic acid export membrane protein